MAAAAVQIQSHSRFNAMKPRTFYDKIWADHLVDEQPDGTCLLYIDRHIVHEVTSPQAFEGLALSGRKVHAPDKTLLVVDHNVPTTDRSKPNPDPGERRADRVSGRERQAVRLEYYDEFDIRQGICHVIGPSRASRCPGVTLVCGDSHTATHGAFGALAYGIGTSEVEHVLADADAGADKSKNMRVIGRRQAAAERHREDIILAIIGEIGTAGGTGYSLEYAGEAIRALSMEGRMTVCNMSVEAGARRASSRPTRRPTLRQGSPQGAEGQLWTTARRYWDTLPTDDGAFFDREVKLDAAKLPPIVPGARAPSRSRR
jgi:3-isopropylmalate/(R)-2-methylmalate dehydratase large subunit